MCQLPFLLAPGGKIETELATKRTHSLIHLLRMCGIESIVKASGVAFNDRPSKGKAREESPDFEEG